ncbi:PRC and DUF2382 domain-containing protein [Dactylosporangium sp. NPDC000521]|uniref:PRC and DUF2382 domain-containing protein n=1 Tax=Dactylosporangium sp. NPDC000521 TaxID=3363975 RepID=UPI0036C7B1DA
MPSGKKFCPAGLRGHDLYDRDGDKVGTIGQIYVDRSGRPAWASVHTGLFGMNESLVPLAGAGQHGDGDLRVGYEKARIKDAPNVDVSHDEPLGADQVQELYRHYDLGWDSTGTEHEVTLHAGRPVVNTETVPVEQVRLGTETVTDHETVGGQVRKERIEADLPGEHGTRRID